MNRFFLFFFILAVYVVSSPPTMTTGDSGEFVTSACTLGISHPPGYPLHCLTGKIFSLLPLSNPAWRVSFGAMVFSALAALFLFLILEKMTGSGLAAGLASFVYAFNASVWAQSVTAKGVYAMNAAFIAGCLYVLLLWQENKRAGYLYLFSLAFGVSLACHYPLMLLAGVSFAALILPDVRSLSLKEAALCFLFAVAGLLAYLYLPLRSQAHPPLDWGSPGTLKTFLDHVLRSQYTLTEFGTHVTIADRLSFVREYFSGIWGLFTVLLVPALIGLSALYRERRRYFWAVLALFATNTFGLIFTLKFAYNPERLSIMTAYYVPSYLAAALCIGFGFPRLGRYLRGAGRAVALALVCAAACYTAVSGFRENAHRNNFLARDYGRNILSFLPERSTLFIEEAGDESLFTTLYLQAVAGVRRDLSVYDCYGNVFTNIYGPGFTILGNKNEWYRRRSIVEKAVIAGSRAPVYYLVFSPHNRVMPFPLVRDGLAYRVDKTGNGGNENAARNAWALYNLRGTDIERSGDFQENEILGIYALIRGSEEIASGRTQEGLLHFEKALPAAADTAWIANNMGLALHKAGKHGEAVAFFDAVLARYPDYVSAWFNKGLCFRAMMQSDKAIESFEKSVRLNPADSDAARELAEEYFYAGAQSYKSRDARAAAAAWEKAVLAKPDHAIAQYNLGVAYLDLKRYADARRTLRAFLALGPDAKIRASVEEQLRSMPE